MNDPAIIERLLTTAQTIAVVGLSDDPTRPVFGVSRYLKMQGYRIIPVNPLVTTALGEKAYPNLQAVPEPIDFVDVFRRPEFIPAIVDDAIAAKVPALWLQDGIIHEEAARRARDAGLAVVMDTCTAREHRRLVRAGRLRGEG